MSPYQIEILMHFYTNQDKHNQHGSSIYVRTVEEFVDLGVIETHEKRRNGYKLTRLGTAWVMAIKSVPIPIVVYVDVIGTIINDLDGKPV